jgi:hypothetical protein
VELRPAPAARLSGSSPFARGGAVAAAALLTILILLAALAAPAPSSAQDLEQPPSPKRSPAGYELTAEEVTAIARGTEAVRRERAEHSDLEPTAYTNGADRWQVSFMADDEEVAQVQVDDGTGEVLEAWTGPQVAWKMARGYDGAFGGRLNSWYVWIPLCLVFLAPFVDPRRPFRMLHLDLLVLLAFSVSHHLFNRGEIFWSVPLAYPVLLYVLVRMLWVGFRPRERRERLMPLVPVTAVALGVLFLVGFRIAFNVIDTSVIDVGYASVVGADVIADEKGLYEDSFPEGLGSGDTYGPVTYLAYLPFEQALPWSGEWDDLPAAHGAAIAFDVVTIVGLFLLGRRLRPGAEGRTLGVALAFAWASYPYTAFVLASNANDSLVAMLVVLALLAVTSAPARGVLLGLAAASKFAPLVLAPLFARGVNASPRGLRLGETNDASSNGGASRPGRRSPRGSVLFTFAFLGTLALLAVLFMPADGPRVLYDQTLGYQAGRDSPFSVWGQVPSLDWLHTAVKVGVVGLGLAVAFVPRRRGPVQLAALGAAVMVALQLAMTHWFYLYVVWFVPLVLVALLATHSTEPRGASTEIRGTAGREERVAVTA